MSNAVKSVLNFTAKTDVLGRATDALGISRSNTALDILTPHVRNSANTMEGKPTTAATGLDPGGWVLPSAKQSLNPATPAAIPPVPPTQDTAANAAMQQQDMIRRRRGIYANIFAGSGASSPVVQNKSQLG